MNKRKLLLVAMSLCMVAILAMGGTLAYLTDTEAATNVFTTGNVDIQLNETFDPNNAKLMPGIDIKKEISITNVGTEPAYVRLHFAIPKILDDGDPTFNASENSLHFNFGLDSMKAGEWNWHKNNEQNMADPDKDVGYPGNGGNWNMYVETIDGIEYNVYIATWTTPLAPDATTDIAVRKVYLDISLDNEQIAGFSETLGEEWKIHVAAEAVQSAGFDTDGKTAYDAFAAAKTAGNLPAAVWTSSDKTNPYDDEAAN